MEAQELNTMLEFFNKFEAIISKRVEIALKNQPGETFQSDSINKLAEALSVAQGEFLDLQFSQVNLYTKTEYNDLESIFKAVRKSLAAHGLSFVQLIDQSTGETIIYTRLLHDSGQWIGSKQRVILIANEQKANDSAIQFAKRQAAMSILGIAGSNDYADDDAVAATAKHRVGKAAGLDLNKNYEVRTKDTITKEQIEELDYELQGEDNKDILRDIYKDLRVESLSDIPKDMYRDTMNKVRSIKALRAGIINKSRI